jgi:hypothetical protein
MLDRSWANAHERNGMYADAAHRRSNKHAGYLSESTWHRDHPSFSSLFNFNPKDILNSAGQWTVKSVPSSLSGRPQNDGAEYVWLHFFQLRG